MCKYIKLSKFVKYSTFLKALESQVLKPIPKSSLKFCHHSRNKKEQSLYPSTSIPEKMSVILKLYLSLEEAIRGMEEQLCWCSTMHNATHMLL